MPTVVRETSLRMLFILTRMAACVISDIVKRRSIRVGSRINSCAVLHYLRIISALAFSREADCEL
jgi:hypothetical protein